MKFECSRHVGLCCTVAQCASLPLYICVNQCVCVCRRFDESIWENATLEVGAGFSVSKDDIGLEVLAHTVCETHTGVGSTECVTEFDLHSEKRRATWID